MDAIKPNKKLSINILHVTFFLFAWYSISQGILAFANPDYSYPFFLLCAVIGYACIPFGFFVLVKNKKLDTPDITIAFIPLIYWIMCILHTYGGWKIGDGLFGCLVVMLFAFFTTQQKYKIFDLFYRIIQILNFLSIIVWICYELHVNIGFEILPYYTGDGAVYIKWFIFAIYRYNFNFDGLDRLCGIFNEPGGLGTICALLFITTYKHTTKWEKALLLITGVLTFSLAFWILIFAFFAIYFIKKDWKYVFLGFAVVIIFFQIPKIDWGNDQLNRFAARFEITQNGLAGDNRTADQFDVEFEKMQKTSKIIFGYGNGYNLTNEQEGSYKRYIVQFGFVGFALLIGGWLCALSVKAKTINDWMLILLFFMSAYQRPNALTSIWGYVMIFGGIEWNHAKDKES